MKKKKPPNWITPELGRATVTRIRMLDKLYLDACATADMSLRFHNTRLASHMRRRARQAWKKYQSLVGALAPCPAGGGAKER